MAALVIKWHPILCVNFLRSETFLSKQPKMSGFLASLSFKKKTLCVIQKDGFSLPLLGKLKKIN